MVSKSWSASAIGTAGPRPSDPLSAGGIPHHPTDAGPNTRLGGSPDAGPDARPDAGSGPSRESFRGTPYAKPRALLEVCDLVKHFPIRGGLFRGVVDKVHAVDGVSFTVAEGETLGIVGESGCGKSTAGRCILRLIEPTAGKVWFDGADLGAMDKRALRANSRAMQIIFQDPFASLNPRMTVASMIGEALAIHRLASSREQAEQRIVELLETVGLHPDHMRRYPHEFSGGQRQRIGIARALAVSPRLIVCDEPVSALDVSIQAQVINLLEDLQERFGLSYLFIAHDLSRPPHRRSSGGHVPRKDRRDWSGWSDLLESQAPVHQGIALRGSGRRSTQGKGPYSHHARRRRTLARRPTNRMPFPHPMLEGCGNLCFAGARTDLRPHRTVGCLSFSGGGGLEFSAVRDLITIVAVIINVASMFAMIVGILLHSGRGGGLSDMFGGGGGAALGSAAAERNLNRITTVFALTWFLTVIALAMLLAE